MIYSRFLVSANGQLINENTLQRLLTDLKEKVCYETTIILEKVALLWFVGPWDKSPECSRCANRNMPWNHKVRLGMHISMRNLAQNGYTKHHIAEYYIQTGNVNVERKTFIQLTIVRILLYWYYNIIYIYRYYTDYTCIVLNYFIVLDTETWAYVCMLSYIDMLLKIMWKNYVNWWNWQVILFLWSSISCFIDYTGAITS